MIARIFSGTLLLSLSIVSFAQDTLKTTQLGEVEIDAYRRMNASGHLEDTQQQSIYSGKKTEVIILDSLDGNKAGNNTRQLLGTIPGLVVVESETGGFVANGFGLRGLNPSQSLEMNVRQNGYNLAADVYGYNESYYLPPMEAVERIEVVRGASSLQFGAQFGGMVNYVLREATTDQPFLLHTSQTIGSFGMYNSFNQVSGKFNKVSYNTFIQYRTLDGWRSNAEQTQLTGYGKIAWQPTEKLSIGIEYSLLRNKIRMPGGLTDEQFEEDSRAAYRSRNWLQSPWNILNATLQYTFNPNSSFSLKSTLLAGERNLVWFDEAPDEPDLKDEITGEFEDREVERESMKSWTNEARFITSYQTGSLQNTLAAGARFAYTDMKRWEDGEGTDGSDFNLAVEEGSWEQEPAYTTMNIAPFFENMMQINGKLSITPGARLEYIKSTIEGEVEDEATNTEIELDSEKTRTFLLLGAGILYRLNSHSQLYGNATQAYRPVDYAQLTPLGVYSKVDPAMKDAKGYNADLGVRGNYSFINFDIGLFYLAYNNRPGLVTKTDVNDEVYTLRTNVANSVHQGIESYTELIITPTLRLFNSLAYIDARYRTGPFKNNRVEFASKIVNRTGLRVLKKWFSTSLQCSAQTEAYADANNSEENEEGTVGEIPGYQVWDWAAAAKVKNWNFRTGVNNLFDERYFTQRADEYPGPGIIPSIGRCYYFGVSLTLQ
jgi:Fe(3+) dicitrate transport protein